MNLRSLFWVPFLVVPALAAGEGDLATIKLTAKVEQRIGLETTKVERRPVPRRRLYGAELVLPPGQSARIVAPFTGLVQTSLVNAFPRAGSRVKQGQVLAGVQPILLEPDRLRVLELQLNLVNQRAVVEAELARAEAELKLARENVNRGVKLVAADAGSARALQEVKTTLASATAARQSAKTRRAMYEELGEISPKSLPTTWLTSPFSGFVRDVTALPGQSVVMGGPILEIADTSTLWAKVAVAVEEVGTVKRGVALIQGVTAPQVEAPPTANLQSATVDFYYLLENSNGRWSPGTRADAQLSLVGQTESLIVPWSAIVSDVNGNSWVYAEVAPHAYARRRVAVDNIQNASAVLSVGPSAGTTIVSVGVVELFGLDVGYAK